MKTTKEKKDELHIRLSYLTSYVQLQQSILNYCAKNKDYEIDNVLNILRKPPMMHETSNVLDLLELYFTIKD